MEISIDNLWQTISETNLIQGIGHYIEISIDSLWQRISETILSKIDTLWQRNLKQFWSMQAVERHLKILIESLGLRISKTFVQTIGYYMEISIGFFLGREYLNLSWLSLYCRSNLVLHGLISMYNLWQTISERTLIQGIGHYIEISIDSLWQRISETILSK